MHRRCFPAVLFDLILEVLLTSFSGLLTFVEIARARIRSAGKGHINGRVTVTLGRWSNALGDP